MTARQCYEAILIELNKENAPNILLEDFNYLFNKAINQYINKRYNIYDINQQTTDDLRVLKATALLTPSPCSVYGEQTDIGRMMGAIYEVTMPSDYLHILNCICIYDVKKTFKCYNAGDVWRRAATRLTADIYSQILDNFWLRPTYRRPYYYIHNVNLDEQKIISTNPYRMPSHVSTVIRRYYTVYEYDGSYYETLGAAETAAGPDHKNEVETITNEKRREIYYEWEDTQYPKNGKYYTAIVTYDTWQDGPFTTPAHPANDDKRTTVHFESLVGTDAPTIYNKMPINTTDDYNDLGDDRDGNKVVTGLNVPSYINGTSWAGADSSEQGGIVGLKDTNISNVERGAYIRYGNQSSVRMEIRYGTDDSLFTLKKVYIDYIKAPQNIRLTQEQLDLTEDTSQMLEFPDYVCQEIINELVHIVMENITDQRLQTHPVVSQSIANPAQGQTEPVAQQG